MLKRILIIILTFMFLLICAIDTGQALATCGGQPSIPAGGFDWPVAGAVVKGWSLDCETDRGHRGIDIATQKGGDIRAAADGIVGFAGYTPAEGGGLTVSISHAGGLKSTYLHLSGLKVKKGDRVVRGEVIGTSQGTFIHFGLKLAADDGVYFDPLEYLPDIGLEAAPVSKSSLAESTVISSHATNNSGASVEPVSPRQEQDGSVVPGADGGQMVENVAVTIPGDFAITNVDADMTAANEGAVEANSTVPFFTFGMPAPAEDAPGMKIVSGAGTVFIESNNGFAAAEWNEKGTLLPYKGMRSVLLRRSLESTSITQRNSQGEGEASPADYGRLAKTGAPQRKQEALPIALLTVMMVGSGLIIGKINKCRHAPRYA